MDKVSSSNNATLQTKMSSPAYDPLIVYYDTETTGLDTASSEIVEFAARVSPPQSVSFSCFVCPASKKIPAELSELNGITFDDVKDSSPFGVVAERFLSWLECQREGKPVILIAHNNFGYDEIIFKRQCLESRIDLPSWVQFGDSLPVFRSCFASKTHKRNTLAALAERFSVAGEQSHRALSDVDMLIQVVERCPDKTKFMQKLFETRH